MPESPRSTQRVDQRPADTLRPVHIEIGPLKFAHGSALIEMGDTRVLIGATVEPRVPPFLAGSGRGWATAEYSMLPCATPTRNTREITRGRLSGRSAEIQRLIGRSLRAVLDLEALQERTLTLDCDVVQADGGTRTAAITGAWLAAVDALAPLLLTADLERWPLLDQVAAISVGVVDGAPLLDLDAPEDQRAEVDFNVVATGDGRLVEIQGTGEARSFDRSELDLLLDLALGGIGTLLERQREAVAGILEEVAAVRTRGSRRPVPPRDEKDLWGAP